MSRTPPACSWLRVSDTSTESAGGAAAAPLLAEFGRLASTKRFGLRRGALAVPCASRACGAQSVVGSMAVGKGKHDHGKATRAIVR